MSNLLNLFGDLQIKEEHEELKQCWKCEQWFPLSCFSPASGGLYRRSSCNFCEAKLVKVRKNLRKEFPVPPNHRCPICLRTEEECKGEGGKKVGAWCADHDHVTGEFRGYVCHRCNRALGLFRDNIEAMKRAIEYLEKPREVVLENLPLEKFLVTP